MHSKTIITLFVSLSMIISAAAAGELPRKAFMGIGGQPAEDGLRVTILLEQATGSMAGIQRGDVIKTVNNRSISDMQSLIAGVAGMNAGDQASFEVIREGRELSLSAAATGRPMETSDNFSVEYGQVEFGNERLRSILYRPAMIESPPVVFFIQGFGCGSIDYGTSPGQTTAQLVRAYAESGFAVFRMEKPGMGDSIGELDCLSIDFPTELEAYAAGLKTLRGLPDIDTGNIFLFGHSLGATAAPLLAQRYDTRGIIAFGSVAKPWDEYLVDIFREQALRTGVDPLEVSRRAALAKPFLYDLIVQKMNWEQLAQRHSEALNMALFGNTPGMLFDRDYRFLASLGSIDLFEAWAEYPEPVLAVYGSYDIQAISDEGARTTAQIVNAYHPGNGTVLIMEQTEHGFARYPGTFEEYVQERDQGRWTAARMGELYDPRVHQETIQWMRNVLTTEHG